MLEKLKGIKERYEQLTALLSDPAVIGDQNRYRELSKEQAGLTDIVNAYDEYMAADAEIESCKAMLEEADDAAMREMIHEELNELSAKEHELSEQLKVMLLPKDPNDDKDVIIEVRAGTGGEEAALFGADLLRMYTRYAERHGYKAELMNENYTEKGGVKEVVLSLQGKGAYSRMKFESGVHRVQRVPETESQGRIHTSAATVAVLPEAEDVEVDINPNDLQIDTYRSGGAGGQHVNKTESAIRITHIPTGLVVQCQDERSQHKNRDKAMRVLKSRLLELYQSKAAEAEADERKSQVGSGDRSERIRTYNFPQSRVTDHRIGLTLYKLEAFLDGDMDEIIDALILAERTRQLSSAEE
ncbi:MAG: peptide chain release factor 1 [Christensenellaceae bacterium]|nr:peptide chain release factor 1 [Christensenellaceae bacterium]MCI7375557.1 peptide chain release factor 1 [Christensenellaceae bacterium]MDD6939300.1 peptide chain release factor 1 [Christensenellaceae bacterium]MDY2747954.1 peptide chain release factor 1 [Eubacteriales bacterium]